MLPDASRGSLLRASDPLGDSMAGFIQIIEFKTSKIDEVRNAVDEFRAAAADTSKARRSTVTEDRERAGTYLNIVEFDSYEEAMENSKNPATQAFAEKMMSLSDGPPTFINLDVRETIDIN
jgi:quinol monooxygenase YgiN